MHLEVTEVRRRDPCLAVVSIGRFARHPGSASPQPEPNATELRSCKPLSASRELHKDGGGGGGVARRARAARSPKAKSCATSFGASSAALSATSCAAGFSTCPSFTCRPRAARGEDVSQDRRTWRRTRHRTWPSGTGRRAPSLPCHHRRHRRFCAARDSLRWGCN